MEVSRVGIRAGRVRHRPLYQPDTTISGTRSLESGPIRLRSGGSQVLSGPEVISEYVCLVPTEIYVRCPRFDPSCTSEMGNRAISA
jgi:hypothetical protein